MKKLLAFMLALFLVFSLCACGAKEADEDKKDSGEKETEAQKVEDGKLEVLSQPDAIVDSYKTEITMSEEYKIQVYFMFGYDADENPISVSYLATAPVEDEEAEYVPSMLQFATGRSEIAREYGYKHLETVYLGFDYDSEANTQTSYCRFQQLNEEDVFAVFAAAELGILSWEIEDISSLSRENVKKNAEEVGLEAVSEVPSDMLPKNQVCLAIPDGSCWFCSAKDKNLKRFEFWDESFCEDCYALVEEYHNSIEECSEYFCESDSDEFFLDKSYGRFYCRDCFNGISTCCGCESTYPESCYRERHDAYYCDECYGDGDFEACDYCKAPTDSLIEYENGSGDKYNLCEDCYNAENRCSECGAEDARRYDGFFWNMCEECFERNNNCRNCYDEDAETSYREEYDGYYCDDCYGDGSLFACYNCDSLVTNVILYEVFNEELCDGCFAAYTACPGCESEDTSYYEEYDEYYCDDCYVADMQKCERCGLLVDELCGVEDYEDYCKSCYAKETVCRECDDYDKATTYYDEVYIWGYYCDDCYAEKLTCVICKDSSKEATYRTDVFYEFICDDCYGDGDIALCLCARCEKIVDETFYYENWEEDVCIDCYKELTVCDSCNDSSKETTYYDTWGYYCDDCYAEVTSCEICGEADATYYEEGNFWGRFCEECYAEVSACEICGEADATYSEAFYSFYCGDCFAKESSVCSYCRDDSKPTAYYEGMYGYNCEDCFKEYSVCRGCKDSSKETSSHSVYSPYKPDGGCYGTDCFYCDDCYDESLYACTHCWALFEEQELTFYEEYEKFLCSECSAEYEN